MKEDTSKLFFKGVTNAIRKTLDLPSYNVPDDFYQKFVDRICYYKFPRQFDPTDALLGSFRTYFTDISNTIDNRQRDIPFNYLCGRDVSVSDFKTSSRHFYEMLSKDNNIIEFLRMLYHGYFLNAVYRFCYRYDLFDTFYRYYMENSVELANSNNFLNHSSCDAVILPLESAIYTFLKEDRNVRAVLKELNRFIVKDSKKTYLVDNFDYKKPRIKLHKLLAKWNMDVHYTYTEYELTDTTLKYMVLNALISVLIYGIVESLSDRKYVGDKKLTLLGADINLFFTRYTTNILTNVSILKELTELKNEYGKLRDIMANSISPDSLDVYKFYMANFRFHKALTPVSEYYFSCTKQNDQNTENAIKLMKTIKDTDDRIFFDKDHKFINSGEFEEKFRSDEEFKKKIIDKVYYENHAILFHLVSEEVDRLVSVARNKLNFSLSNWVFEQIGERLYARKGDSFIIPSFFYEYYIDESYYL